MRFLNGAPVVLRWRPLEGVSVRLAWKKLEALEPWGLRARVDQRLGHAREGGVPFSPRRTEGLSRREIEGKSLVADQMFAGKAGEGGRHGACEWAVVWLATKTAISRPIATPFRRRTAAPMRTASGSPCSGP